MAEQRPAISEAIKRSVRKRCAFGCVLCGSPVYHYDHIVEYSIIKEHTPENITLLCGSHHDQKTRGQIPIEIIRKADANPFNRRNSYTSPQTLYFNEGVIDVWLGHNMCTYYPDVGTFSLIRMNGHSMLELTSEDGHLLISAELNGPSGENIIKIEKSEIVVSTDVLDVVTRGSSITISPHDGLRPIVLERSGSSLRLASGEFRVGGSSIQITPTDVVIDNHTHIDGNKAHGRVLTFIDYN